MDNKELEKRAIEKYQELSGEPLPDSVPQAFLDRLKVNYIRHQLTDYDHQVKLLKIRYLRKIKKEYPQLSGEINSQIEFAYRADPEYYISRVIENRQTP